MPLDQPQDPRVDPEDGSMVWAAVGYQGTVLQVRRFPDGTIAFGTFNKDDEQSKFYAMRLSQEAVFHLMAFMMGQDLPPKAMN